MLTLEALAEWLKQRDDFALFGHISPDGDACGSCMAMYLALKTLGKRVCVVLPGGMPELYASFPHAEEAIAAGNALPFVPRTAFALDVSGDSRLGAGTEAFDACEAKAVLDHHATNTGFGDVWHVEGDRAANGEMVLELIHALGVEVSVEMAEWIYVAVMTDCGQFGFSNTSEKTMLCAAELLRIGVDSAEITRKIYHTRTRGRTLLLGKVLAGLETGVDGKLVWARLTDRMLEEAGAKREDNEGVVNYLLDIDTAEIAVLAEEREDGIKFSLRSKNGVDVANGLAKPFGGGGHSKAAGVTISAPMEEALKTILARAEQLLTEVK